MTKYYYAGSQRIAMRKNGTLTFILGDHLGSTSLVTDASGVVINQTQYKACPLRLRYGMLREGEIRYSSGSNPTDYTYTSQYSYTSDFGLHFYNARWYDSSLGRFAQADTIVSGGIQGYDRYAYVGNNPIRYKDSSGHTACLGANWDDGPQCFTSKYASSYGIKTKGMSESEVNRVVLAAALSGEKFSKLVGGNAQSAFRKAHGNISIEVGEGKGPRDNLGNSLGNCETVGGNISCESSLTIANTLHEFGHVLDNLSGLMASDLDPFNYKGNPIDGGAGNSWKRESQGFLCVNSSDCMEHPDYMGYGTACTSSSSPECIKLKKIEQWGDLYMNWVLDGSGDPNHGFSNDVLGDGRREFMKDQFNWLYSNGYLP